MRPTDMDLVILCVLLTVTSVVTGLPVGTLNEKKADVSWEAWLLLDDQNYRGTSSQDTSHFGRRRIVPKSVFIAPSFSPQSLPNCSEGYREDEQLRCIRIVKIDEDSHWDFLIDKLKNKYGDIDYDYEQISTSSESPFQVNIPLVGDYESTSDDSGAIIVTPTKKNVESFDFDLEKSSDDVEKDLIRLIRTTTTNDYSTTFNDNNSDITTENSVETSTITTDTTAVDEITTTFATTTLYDEYEKQLLDTNVDKETTTEEIITTTIATPTITTTKNKDITTYHPLLLTTNPPTTESNNRIIFPYDKILKQQKTTLYDFVKFPDESDTPKTKSEVHTRDINSQMYDLSEDVATSPRKWSFAQDERNSNRRNRERHNSLFLLQPRWGQNKNKPLVLKISRNEMGMVDLDRINGAIRKAVRQQDFGFLFRPEDR